jgi:hypothetical protein
VAVSIDSLDVVCDVHVLIRVYIMYTLVLNLLLKCVYTHSMYSAHSEWES